LSRRWFEQLPINGWDALQLGGRLEVKEAVEEAVEEKDDEEDEGDDVKAGEEEVAEEDTDE
jgi:hypothetical protein